MTENYFKLLPFMFKTKEMFRSLSFFLLAVILLGNLFLLVEGTVVDAASSTVTTTVTSSAGAVGLTYPVELTVTSELSLTCDVATSTLLSSIAGMTGGTATASRGCIVKTNNYDGWTMTAKASTSPAMVNTASSSATLADAALVYATWSAPTVASSSKFGFNVTGNYASANFSGSKYTGFNGVATITIATSTVPTAIAGESIVMNYQAQVLAGSSVATGLYRSWTTITAYMN